jgi:hypothetical protein
MTDLEGRPRAVFGDRELAPGTFFAFEHALRFDLGGDRMELSVIERFLTEIDRAWNRTRSRTSVLTSTTGFSPHPGS